MKKRYNDLNSWLQKMYGCRVHKISIDAGFSCPNRDGTISSSGCIFCNAHGSGTGAHAKGLSITDQIMNSKSAIIKRFKAKKYIAYFQSFTNTYAPVETLKALYEEALAVKDVVGLSIGTRPDCINEPILKLLQEYSTNYLIWLEYGLQSADDSTLTFINRGHTFQCFADAVKMSQGRNLKICAHVILGLPNEGKKHIRETAKAIANLGIDGVKLHLLYVIKGTLLENLYKEKKYTCLEQQEYVDAVCDFIEYMPDNIIIQRLTSDPHPKELVAPTWALNKQETTDLIKKTFEKRDSYQGMKSLENAKD